MILDPYRDGCHIWIDDNVTYIKGKPDEVCSSIYQRCIIPRKNSIGMTVREQIHEIGIDISGGIGKIYKDILSSMGIKTYEIKGGHVDVILPIRFLLGKPAKRITYEDIKFF